MKEHQERYEETFATWNKVAKLYQDKFMDLDLYDASYDRFCELIPRQGASILEIGCGPGNITKYVLSKRPDLKIEGIDVSPEMIGLAKQNNPSANFRVMDCRALDTLRAEFDGIICGFCIPYLSPQDCAKLIKDCAALMKEGAVLYLSFVEGKDEQSGFQAGSSGDRTYFYFHDLKRLKEEFDRSDLAMVNTEIKTYQRNKEILEAHTLMILRKNKSR